MKRSIFSLIVFVALVATSAKTFGQAEVSLGIKGGLNFANVNTSSASAAYESRTGYHAGAFVNIKLTKIAIQPEIIFSQQGSKVTIPSSGSSDATFNYVNIPVMLKFYVVGGFNLQVGPQFGFLSGTGGSIPGTSQNWDSVLKGSDISVGLGAGFDLPLKFTIDARYNLGVSEINDSAGSDAAKNQVFQLSLGYKLFKFGN